MKTDEEQWKIRRYLLGSLDDAERDKIEERIITDSEFSEKVAVVECELIDDYLANALADDDAKRFREHFLSTIRQSHKLDLAKALANYPLTSRAPARVIPKRVRLPAYLKGRFRDLLGNKEQPRLSLLTAIGITVFVASIIAVGWWIVTEQDQSLKAELVQLNNPDNPDPRTLSDYFIIGPLRPGLVRELEETQKAAIPRDTDIVQLQLETGVSNYPSYQATLHTDGGREVFTLAGLKSITLGNRKIVVLNIPSRILTAGDYQLKLSGVTLDGQLIYIGQYVFRIVDM